MIVTEDPAALFGDDEMVTLRRDSCPTLDTDLDLVVRSRRAATKEQAATERARLAVSGVSTDTPCYLSGILYRRHTQAVRALCDEWWYWYGQSETQRDQPSLAMAVQRCGIEPNTVIEKEISGTIRHNTRKADADGVRARVIETTPAAEHTQPRRRGDRL
jgi:hypothetical protein